MTTKSPHCVKLAGVSPSRHGLGINVGEDSLNIEFGTKVVLSDDHDKVTSSKSVEYIEFDSNSVDNCPLIRSSLDDSNKSALFEVEIPFFRTTQRIPSIATCIAR